MLLMMIANGAWKSGGQTGLDCPSTRFKLLHVLTCHGADDGLREDDDDDDDDHFGQASCDIFYFQQLRELQILRIGNTKENLASFG